MMNIKMSFSLLGLFICIFIFSACETLMLPEREMIINSSAPPDYPDQAALSSQPNMNTNNCVFNIRQNPINSMIYLIAANEVLKYTKDPNAAAEANKFYITLNGRQVGTNIALVEGIPPGWYTIKIYNGYTKKLVYEKAYYINQGEKINVQY